MRTLTVVLILSGSLVGMAPQMAKAQQDSVKRKRIPTHMEVTFSKGKRDSTGITDPKSGYFVGGITFTRLDIGFSKLVDNGSFTLSPTNDFLSYRPGKTSTVSFDILQLGYRFTPHFKIYLAGGFDWNLIRLKNDITISKPISLAAVSMPAGVPYVPTLGYTPETIHFSKNRFSSSYLHIPFNFEFRTNEDDRGNRFYVVVGPEIGFLLSGKVKQISDERGKEKFKDDYYFQPFRVGGTARLGYGSLGVFYKYYDSDMFTTVKQKGLKNMSFGITFGLN